MNDTSLSGHGIGVGLQNHTNIPPNINIGQPLFTPTHNRTSFHASTDIAWARVPSQFGGQYAPVVGQQTIPMQTWMNIPEVTATLVSRMQHAQTEPDAIVNVIPADSSIYATAGTNFILASDAPDPNGSNNGNSVFNAPVDEVIERLRDEATARAVRFVEHVSGMEEFRQLCFDITSEEDLKFPKALFDMYWVKDVEHIFAKDSGRRPLKKSGGFTQYYSCRRANKSHGYKPVPIEERKRSKSQRVPDQCDVRVSSPICIDMLELF